MNQFNVSYIIGNSLDDISLARKSNMVSVILSKKNMFIKEANPDYYITDLAQLKNIDCRVMNKIMFKEINIIECPKYSYLNEREKLFLQDHFRRIQQHSLIMGKFMSLQARELNEDPMEYETTGVLHDIDYARSYYNMENHGLSSPSILKKYSINKNIVLAIKYHSTFKFAKTKFFLGWSVHISEMFTKRFVHTIRKFNYQNISDVKFDKFMNVYLDKDFRKNERLTHLEEPSMPFDLFKEMMNIYDRDIDGYPISRMKLFSLLKSVFIELNIFPLSIKHREELKNLKLIDI